MHSCPVTGCDTQVADERLMCGYHWSKVPAALQQPVYQTYRAKERAVQDLLRANTEGNERSLATLTDKHRQAIENAVASVERRSPRTVTA